MKRMVVLGAVCMMLAAATLALAGFPTMTGGWPVLEVGKEYLFRSSPDNNRRATVVSQKGQWVTATDSSGNPSLVNLENVFYITD